MTRRRFVRLISFAAAAAVLFAFGVAASVFPQTHPRGLIGITVDGLISTSENNDLTEADCDKIPRPSECDGLISDLASERRAFLLRVAESSETASSPVEHREVVSRSALRFSVSTFQVPGSYSYYLWGEKPTNYVATEGAYLYAVAGDGAIFQTPMAGLGRSESVEWTSLPHDLLNFLDLDLSNPGFFSVKGVKIHEGEIFIAASSDAGEDSPCWHTAVYVANIETDSLNFKPLFEPNDCADPDVGELVAHQAGGAFEILPDGRLAFGSGEYRQRNKAQEAESQMGGLIALDKNGEAEIIAKGLRNPQGSLIDPDGETLWIVDQGPGGGDELNRLDLTTQAPTNFGWPISSYGNHYGGREIEGAPLYDSHSDYGFEEPVWHWTPSIASSSISASPSKWPGEIAIGSLGHNPTISGTQAIHLFSWNSEAGAVALHDVIRLKERVRSIAPLGDDRLVASVDSGNLAVITLK